MDSNIIRSEEVLAVTGDAEREVQKLGLDLPDDERPIRNQRAVFSGRRML